MPDSLRTVSQVPLPAASVFRYTVPDKKLPQAAKTVSVTRTSVRIARSVQPTSPFAGAATTFDHVRPPTLPGPSAVHDSVESMAASAEADERGASCTCDAVEYRRMWSLHERAAR